MQPERTAHTIGANVVCCRALIDCVTGLQGIAADERDAGHSLLGDAVLAVAADQEDVEFVRGVVVSAQNAEYVGIGPILLGCIYFYAGVGKALPRVDPEQVGVYVDPIR
jgi:hypothetical protein